MGIDPEGALRTLTDYRQVLSNCVEQYQGRGVNAPGDSTQAEVASVVDAVNGAVEITRNIISQRVLGLPD